MFVVLILGSCHLSAQDEVLAPMESFSHEPQVDTLSLPPLTYRGTIAHYPYYLSPMMGFGDWSLHAGLNASFSASAIFGLGHNAGSGFANSLALAYAGNLTPKLSYSLGGYTSFLEYSGYQVKDAGLTAMLNYRFDEHWEAALLGQKSVIQPNIAPSLYWMGMGDIGDKIGASLRYNLNPQFSFGLSVWKNTTTNQPYFYRRPPR